MVAVFYQRSESWMIRMLNTLRYRHVHFKWMYLVSLSPASSFNSVPFLLCSFVIFLILICHVQPFYRVVSLLFRVLPVFLLYKRKLLSVIDMFTAYYFRNFTWLVGAHCTGFYWPKVVLYLEVCTENYLQKCLVEILAVIFTRIQSKYCTWKAASTAKLLGELCTFGD